MNFITIILIGIGLAMDCLAVAITSGVCMPCIKPRKAFQIALFFGLFQGGMPVLGWLLGSAFKNHIASYDHWIAFGILFIIGAKMIIEAIKEKPGERVFNLNNFFVLLSLSVATSIDALIVGMSFAILDITIWQACTLIGFITFFISLFGIFVGKRYGFIFGKKAEIFGGIVLIAIGLKVLLEHIIL